MKALRMPGLLVIVLLCCLASTQAIAKEFPYEKGNDNYTALGVFRFFVLHDYRGMVDDWATAAGVSLPACVGNELTEEGCWDILTGWLSTPIMADQYMDPLQDRVMIARSVPHLDGSPEDLGTAVGVSPYSDWVSELDLVLQPDFAGPNGITEIHTAVSKMWLVNIQPGAAFEIKAGRFYDSPGEEYKLCPGEIESQTGTDLPGEAYFDLYVHIRILDIADAEHPDGVWGADMELTNEEGPLLIMNDNVNPGEEDDLLYEVILAHGNPRGVLLTFSKDNGTKWKKGDRFGYIVVAGAGLEFGSAKGGPEEFLTFMNDYLATVGPMPVEETAIPTLTEWGLIIFGVLLAAWMAWMIMRRRRRVTASIG